MKQITLTMDEHMARLFSEADFSCNCRYQRDPDTGRTEMHPDDHIALQMMVALKRRVRRELLLPALVEGKS